MNPVDTVLSYLRALPSQQGRSMRLHTSLGGERLAVETLSGLEQVDGAGFRLVLTALSAEAGLDLDALLGRPALLQLLTADAGLRPFHGQVTSAELVGSNGGLARYRLVLEPWLSLLGQRVDSYAFQDMSVVEIVENVFSDYAGLGTLAPRWRWDLADASVYRKRSLCTQYQESDLAFLQRLLAEEGIAYWFEHRGEADSDGLGEHVLVLADHAPAWHELGTVRFHRADATERSDGVQGWQDARRWRTGQVLRASWDYRSLELGLAQSSAPMAGLMSAEDVDMGAPYGWPDTASGERLARRHLEALQVPAHTVQGQGSWRQLAAGGRFVLTQHPQAGNDGYACLQVWHRARNNLGAEVFDALEQALGAVAAPGLALPATLAGHACIADESWPEVYQNRFVALPVSVAYRPRTEDDRGVRLHPRPTVAGTQSAIVVSDGEPALADRDHRIKVQFPWQRGADASSGQAHPAGEDNAPGLGSAWTWVRVSAPWAGDNWGGVMLPRKGQEVLVAFLEGDIDRPVVVGSVYNGRGQADAAHNQVGGGGAGATGNAPSWFDGNEHAAVFTGFKSQALAHSQDGSGGYQQLRLDDTPGQGRAQLSTTQQQSTLTLGHLKGGQDNVREGERGFGAELSTQARGTLRGGQGLLLSSETGRQQLSAGQAQAQLAEGQQLLQTLAEAARGQQAQLPGEPQALPADTSWTALHESLQATQQGSAAGAIAGGDGQAPGWSAPVLLGSGQAGVMSLTPADQSWISGTQTVLAAGTALNWLSQGQLTLAVAGGLMLYTQGSEAASGSPTQERGIALHAAQGKVSARAHRNAAKLAAKTNVRIASTGAGVEIAAPNKHLLATAAGAYLRIEGDNIELGAPGTVEFKASQANWTSGKSVPTEKPFLPNAGWTHWIEINHRDIDDEPFAGQAYKILFEDGTVISGKLDDKGHALHAGVPKQAERVEYEWPEPLKEEPWPPLSALVSAVERKLG
jgi:type VI secretion system VgrG family protein